MDSTSPAMHKKAVTRFSFTGWIIERAHPCSKGIKGMKHNIWRRHCICKKGKRIVLNRVPNESEAEEGEEAVRSGLRAQQPKCQRQAPHRRQTQSGSARSPPPRQQDGGGTKERTKTNMSYNFYIVCKRLKSIWAKQFWNEKKNADYFASSNFCAFRGSTKHGKWLKISVPNSYPSQLRVLIHWFIRQPKTRPISRTRTPSRDFDILWTWPL